MMNSQGAAVMHNVIPLLSAEVKNQILGGVLFGDTKNTQSNGSIPGIPKENLMIFCEKDDAVCWGKLAVTAGHLMYTQNGDIDRAVNFLASKVDSALGKVGR
jgi:cutinase